MKKRTLWRNFLFFAFTLIVAMMPLTPILAQNVGIVVSNSNMANSWENIYYGNASNADPDGSLLLLQNRGLDKFRVDRVGNVTATKFIGDGSGLTGLSGTSQWTTTGSNIYYNSGSVGIGTASPSNRLHVNGATRIVAQGMGWDDHLNLYSNDGSNRWNVLVDNGASDSFRIAYNGGSVEAININTSGNVGIGTNNPTSKLTVSGDLDMLVNNIGRVNRLNFESASLGENGDPTYFYRADNSADRTRLRLNLGDENTGHFEVGYHAWNDGSWNERFSVDGSGNGVFAGTISSPQLCLAGDCKTSWPSGATTQWTTNGSSIYYNGGNVGLGTTNPSTKLDVSGGDINLSNNQALRHAGIWTLGGDGSIISLGSQSTNRNVGIYTNGTTPAVYANTSGNVGIGTVNPSNKLQVNGATRIVAQGAGWDDHLNLYSNDGSNRWNVLVDNGASDSFRIAYNGGTAQAMNISTSGNVGIGTNNLNAKLNFDIVNTNSGIAWGSGPYSRIYDDADLNIWTDDTMYFNNAGGVRMVLQQDGELTLRHPNAGGSNSIVFPSTVNSGSDYGSITYYDDNDSYDYWGTGSENSALVIGNGDDPNNANSDVVVLAPSASTIVDSNMVVNGNVGLGTANPSAKLDVFGGDGTGVRFVRDSGLQGFSFEHTSSGNSFNLLGGAAGKAGYIFADSASPSLTIGIVSNNPLIFRTSNSERMRINGAGNVGVGTANPGYKLDVAGEIRATNRIYGGNDLYLTNVNPIIGTNNENLRLVAGGGEVMRLTGAGNVGIGTDSPSYKLDVVSSDLPAIHGSSVTGYGVYGEGMSGVRGYGDQNNGYGVQGDGSIGVAGWAPTGLVDGVGVYGSGYTGVRGDGEKYDFYAAGSGAGHTDYGTFTGAHDVELKDGFGSVEQGMLVSATGNVQYEEESISSTIMEVELSSIKNDSKVLGALVAEQKEIGANWYESTGKRLGVVNALGEGRLWVTNYGGNIKTGDYITTSPVAGYGMLQEDDLMHSYTVGKATQNIDWDKVTDTVWFGGKEYKKAMIAVIYTAG